MFQSTNNKKTTFLKIIYKNIFWVLLIILITLRYFLIKPVYKNGDTLRITTTVSSDPITYGNYQYFSAAGLKVYLPIFPEINYGDGVILEGVVNNGKLDNPKLVSINNFQSFGSSFRNMLIGFYQESLPQPISGLIAGIVLGSKGSLSSDFWEKVKSTGIAHVVVASGTNVTFVIAFVFGVISYFLPRRKSIPIVILSIILYLFMSGFQVPLIRASVMAGLTFLVQMTGRLSNAWRIFFLTAGIMLVINPDWISDIGFILSFVSTGSIMLFNKPVSKVLRRIPKIFRESFATSLSAQIGVAPVLFVTFGRFNILSPIINMLVLWTIPYIMILGSLGAILGLIFPALGKLVLYASYPLTWWFTKVVEIFS